MPALGSGLTGLGNVLTAGEPGDGINGGAGGGGLVLEVTVQASDSAAGAVTCTGAHVGDQVVGIIDPTGVVDARLYFEATITVANQIQQTAAFPGAVLLVPVFLRRP